MNMVKELRNPISIELQKLIMNFFNPIYEKAKEAMIYSYTRNINGFAAILEEKEAASIA
ncbi:subtilisin-like serine protease, partial [Trifolium medium]|nr:subtilisin-like serine protease [Trifolium medium]